MQSYRVFHYAKWSILIANIYKVLANYFKRQKQPFADDYQNKIVRFSWRFCYIHRKTPVLESLFNNTAGLEVCNFIKKRLQHRGFPVKMANLRTALEHLWWLLLKRSYITPPEKFCIWRNGYEFSKFSNLASLSQYGNTSWAIHPRDICHDSASKGKKQFSTTYSSFTSWPQ